MAVRILVIDDDDVFRYVTTRQLRDAGFDVVDAHDYRDALQLLDDGAPDLLLVDIVIPGVNGFALARMARMKHQALKSIYMTAYDVDTSEAVGTVMRKPFDEATLLREISRSLMA